MPVAGVGLLQASGWWLWGIISLPGVNQEGGVKPAGGLIKPIWFRWIGVDQGGHA